MDPNTCFPFSSKKAWWRCRKCSAKWQTSISHRTAGSGCPECARELKGVHRQRPLLCLERPDLYASTVEAPGVDAAGLTCGSNIKVVWSCKKCRPPNCMHTRAWTAGVQHRVKHGCPYCSKRQVCACTSLAGVYPEIASEWGDRKGVLRPDTVSPHLAGRCGGSVKIAPVLLLSGRPE